MSLGSQIRLHRQRLGLTLDQLSERAEVDVGTISALENRNSERSMYAAKIAAGLGMSLDQLLAKQDPFGARAEALRLREGFALNEPPPAFSAPSWPFARLTPADVSRLDEVQLAQLESFALGLLASGKQLRAQQK